jgi:hypothetical protein
MCRFRIVMNRIVEVLQLYCWCGGALLLGLALCFPCFSFLPFYWGLGLFVVFLLCFAGCVSLRRRAIPPVYMVSGVLYSAAFALLLLTCTGIEKVEQYDCNWKQEGDIAEVDLRIIGGFGWGRVESRQLTEHLRKDKPQLVRVEVPIIRDFGRVRARGAIQRADGIPVREE